MAYVTCCVLVVTADGFILSPVATPPSFVALTTIMSSYSPIGAHLSPVAPSSLGGSEGGGGDGVCCKESQHDISSKHLATTNTAHKVVLLYCVHTHAINNISDITFKLAAIASHIMCYVHIRDYAHIRDYVHIRGYAHIRDYVHIRGYVQWEIEVT